jgi:endo-1,4-beta-xylanase
MKFPVLMKSSIFIFAATGLVLLSGVAAAQTTTNAPTDAATPAATNAPTGDVASQPTLKDAFKGQFLIGAALGNPWFDETSTVHPGLVQEQFNSISPGNVLKWDSTEPKPGQFHFDEADKYVDFGTRNGMFVVGHTLVWHSQTPKWVFEDDNGNPTDRDTLLARMRSHILAVVGRYKGRIKSWDVVNEAINMNGSLHDSPWRKIIGDDYIEKAFEFAHEADPDAELYYNDYWIENGAKRKGVLALVEKLKAAGVPITGVGIQDHVNLRAPSAQDMDATITALGKLGMKVAITELDVDVLPSRSGSLSADVSRNETADPALNPYTSGLPDDIQQALASRYAEIFGVFLKHRGTIERVTFWGVTDADTWLDNWPIKGRTNYPLLFDRSGQPKPAFNAVILQAKAASAPPL